MEIQRLRNIELQVYEMNKKNNTNNEIRHTNTNEIRHTNEMDDEDLDKMNNFN